MRELKNSYNNVDIVNFYKNKEPKYATDHGTFISYDNTGLKGDVAEWVRNGGTEGITRVHYVNYDGKIPKGVKIISAIGFNKNGYLYDNN